MSWKTEFRSLYYLDAPEPDDPVIVPAQTALLVIDVQNTYLQRPDRATLPLDKQKIHDLWTPFHLRMKSTVIPQTAKMLQVVNSAFFALHREISDPNDAVMFLGAERTKSLIMLAKIFSQFDNTKCAGFAPDKLWGHSMNVGELARRIARSQGLDAKLCEMAFTAGLLHDVGKLLLAANLPGSYSQVLTDGKRKQISPSEAERAAYGTTHAEIGACLLGIWGLPLNILEAIAWHHAPRHGIHQRFSLLTAVHAANVLLYEMQKSPAETGAPPAGFDLEYLHSLGLADEVETWRGLVPGAE